MITTSKLLRNDAKRKGNVENKFIGMFSLHEHTYINMFSNPSIKTELKVYLYLL